MNDIFDAELVILDSEHRKQPDLDLSQYNTSSEISALALINMEFFLEEHKKHLKRENVIVTSRTLGKLGSTYYSFKNYYQEFKEEHRNSERLEKIKRISYRRLIHGKNNVFKGKGELYHSIFDYIRNVTYVLDLKNAGIYEGTVDKKLLKDLNDVSMVAIGIHQKQMGKDTRIVTVNDSVGDIAHGISFLLGDVVPEVYVRAEKYTKPYVCKEKQRTYIGKELTKLLLSQWS